MNEQEFIDKKDLRDKAIEKVEVLDKVKKLFMIPSMDVMTIGQVAEYYGVSNDLLRKCYQNNKNEINDDGTYIKTSKDFLMGNYFTLETDKGGSTFRIDENTALKIPNRGIRCFSKRAILRIGMLLRNSEVAKEVRTQLLNTFEHSSNDQRTMDIDTEQGLYLRFAKAAIEGSKDDLLFAAQEVFEFKNRHIKTLEEKNSDLEQDNKMLSAQILEWNERSKINKAIRVIAGVRKVPFGYVWRDLYQELLYKHHIGLSQRGDKPYIQHVKEDEWPMVQQSLAAICEDNGVSISKVLWKIKHDDVKKYEDDKEDRGEAESAESVPVGQGGSNV